MERRPIAGNAHRAACWRAGAGGLAAGRVQQRAQGWSDFESLWMPLTRDAEPQRLPFLGAVTACTWGEDRLDVFARALNGHLYHARWEGGWDRG